MATKNPAKKVKGGPVKKPAKGEKAAAKKAGLGARKASVVKKAAAPRKPVAPVTPKAVVSPVRKAPVASKVDKKSMENLKEALIKMRDRLTGQITSLTDDSLKYVDDTSSEDRTDDFDREFALNLMSTEQDALFEIDGALRRISEGAYGLCDGCGCAIEKARLQALPFARMCIRCQSEMEKGRVRFRPFGETISQVAEPVAEVAEPEETE